MKINCDQCSKHIRKFHPGDDGAPIILLMHNLVFCNKECALKYEIKKGVKL